MRNPSVVILAGPNGAGKSTVAPELLRGTLAVDVYVNPDLIAQGLAGFDLDSVAVRAATLMLERIHDLAASRVSFAFETTLASRSYARWLRELRVSGYTAHLVFLWLPSVEIALQRVAQRVRLGGHGIAAHVVRRRYSTGLRNFLAFYQPIVNTWSVYDSSVKAGPRLIALGSEGTVPQIRSPRAWARIKECVT